MLFLQSCKNHKEPYLAIKSTANQEHPGKKLMETNCYVCHSPTASMDDRIGPPMIAIKKHYLTEGISKEQFIADIQNWIKNPKYNVRKKVEKSGFLGLKRKKTWVPDEEFVTPLKDDGNVVPLRKPVQESNIDYKKGGKVKPPVKKVKSFSNAFIHEFK